MPVQKNLCKIQFSIFFWPQCSASGISCATSSTFVLYCLVNTSCNILITSSNFDIISHHALHNLCALVQPLLRPFLVLDQLFAILSAPLFLLHSYISSYPHPSLQSPFCICIPSSTVFLSLYFSGFSTSNLDFICKIKRITH